MDQYQCFECGMISKDECKVKTHMRTVHMIKVETEHITRKFSCSLCKFSSTNMNELKCHLIYDHKKDPHNWMVGEIEAKFKCDECDSDFPRKSETERHMNLLHSDDRGITKTTNITIEAQQDVDIKLNQTPLISGNFPCDCTFCGELLRDN